ncbi:Eco57I restriction-modification methylase domain-containing protein [Rhizobium leguminosarum]|uniref:Eco57I restriction-modification methylase domain-containing protein n=1 Tax=Rhizobium leguminosarum TaxID=384 RepID=UPI0014418447|nr:N-6 DNA methylase [Rhizobium leguminosarum]MBY5870318.1 N-6 DNA methylase [Rhizobium leguminosarum]NKM09353.1 N-6 DNA methylase [Rhizobium leguminosarum bv. viciae]
MARHARRSTDIGLSAISIEGGLISPAQIALVAATTPDQKAAQDYGCPKGTNLRDEITRYFRISQAHWQGFARIERPNSVQTAEFVRALLEQGFGFEKLTGPHRHHLEEHDYRITFEARNGRVPIVVANPLPDADAFTKSLPELGDNNGGTIARRSPVVLLQDWLNANDKMLWGLCFAGDRLRLMRDNASITRQAFIEADLGAIFRDEIFADFTALWLLIHATRFGAEDATPESCPLERWRIAGQQAGTAARDRLRGNVEDALVALGQGFLDANSEFRARLDNSEVQINIWFAQLLRVVYRLIFLAVAEDRDLLHPRNTSAHVRGLYQSAYGFDYLRERSARRAAHDHHHDAWEGMQVVFSALERSEKLLGLPALSGLFAPELTRDINDLKLPNKAFLAAVFRLSYLVDNGQRVRINWRDMATEELGSVYESLLELVPIRENQGRTFAFAGGAETKGNSRKVSGSYYTPDSLVQALLDTTLDPVLDKAEAEGGADAILNLTVIDPACGSGHFLLGAARRMATRVAQIRSPDAPDYNAAMRDVVRSSIYGVDRNPMAVELTKVALWIETVEPGKPLGFLDANIRCGDSLLGVLDLKVLERGIPDAAYKPLTGDDKEAAKVAGKVNKQQRDSRTRDLFGHADAADLAAAAKKLHEMGEDTPAQLRAKAEAFAALHRGKSWWAKKTASDLYITAFLRPKQLRKSIMATSKELDLVPTTLDVRTALAGGQGNPRLTAAAIDLAGSAYAFHWALEFADIMAAGGFDVVIGNPPWEVMQLSEEEYFATRDADIAALAGAARKTAIAELTQANPELHRSYEWAKRTFEAANEFSRESGRFELTARGKVNTYALFAEHFLRLANKKGGRAGIIVPTGIATDATTAPFFGHLVETQRLASLIDFENRDGLFASVHRSFKFCLLAIGSGVKAAEFSFFLADPSQMDDERRRFRLTPEQISRINPNTKTTPVFRSQRDAELTAQIYDRVPVLIDESKGAAGNPWGIEFRQGLFNMTSDSGLFRTAADLTKAGFTRDGTDWSRSNMRYVPLYEAKMIHQFDHRWASYEGTETVDVTEADKQNPDFEVTPRYWVPQDEVDSRLAAKGWHRRWLMGWRDICRATDERTVIAGAFPRFGVGHTSPLFFVSAEPQFQAIFLSNMSALVLDYVARQKIGGTHLTYGYMNQLPFFAPTSYSTEDTDFLIPRIGELLYVSRAMSGLGNDIGFNGHPFEWNTARRSALRAEIDAFYAIKYGMTRDELRYILDPTDVMGDGYPSETFRVLRNNQIREFGEYRTRRLVLEAYDQLAAAK